jgi:hypothetical protein
MEKIEKNLHNLSIEGQSSNFFKEMLQFRPFIFICNLSIVLCTNGQKKILILDSLHETQVRLKRKAENMVNVLTPSKLISNRTPNDSIRQKIDCSN